MFSPTLSAWGGAGDFQQGEEFVETADGGFAGWAISGIIRGARIGSVIEQSFHHPGKVLLDGKSLSPILSA
ncbi:MAG: hypothetical protein ISN28_14280 [Ectothiorhodospiraceae bacterium AqS1]|nr:hypothetical protein [Ectothiorhodospiraceae bacterium AqS1]